MTPLRVLIVAYAFPPRGGVAVQRVLSWVRHFPDHDIEPIVLTVTPPRGTVQTDAGLLDRVPPGTRVIRTPSLEPYRLYRAIGGQRAQDDPRQRETQVAEAGSRGGVGDRLYRAVQERWLVPDPKIGWFPFALEAVRGLLAEGTRPDIILATHPPASALIIGSAIARLCDRPLVVDYRDPWTTGYYPLDRPLAVAARERALEQRVLQEAALVTTVSTGFAKKLSDLVEESAEFLNKIEVIENGWVQDFELALDSYRPDRNVILHTGSLYAQRSPEPFLRAVARLQQARPTLMDGWVIRWIGNVDPQYLRLAESLGVLVEHNGFVDHPTALAAQQRADILLLSSEGMLTAKVYEYLQARRPILGISNSPELDAYLQSWGAGRAFAPDQVEAIAAHLEMLIEQRNATAWPITLDLKRDLATVERGTLAARYAALLHEVAAKSRQTPAYTARSHD